MSAASWLESLARVALSDASSEPKIQAKARALIRLVDAGDRSPLSREQLRVELQRIAEAEAVSARGLEGVLRALATLEAMDSDRWEWPSETPDEPAPTPGYWPWRTREQFDADPFAALDMAGGLEWKNTHGHRDAWRRRLEGPPPWPAGASFRRRQR